jgi:ABC-type amino acid transport substrate-binding protein
MMFAPGTDPAIVQRFDAAHRQLTESGEKAAILDKYLKKP